MIWRGCGATSPSWRTQVHGRPLVYLDNAASTQKPQAVIDAIRRCYAEYYANVDRGVHTLSQRATEAREQARETVRRFLNARSAEEIVFVRGTTEAINLVAASWGRKNVGPGDEILITGLEHHSNIVPWQMLCEEQGRPPRGGADRRPRRRPAGRIRAPALSAAPASWRSPTSRTPWARSTPSREMAELAHARGRRGAGGRRPGGAPPGGRRPGPGLRLLRLLRPQGLRADRHRRALGALRAAGRDAALAGRRRHDPHRLVRQGDLRRRRPTGSRPARRSSRAPSASPRPSTT